MRKVIKFRRFLVIMQAFLHDLFSACVLAGLSASLLVYLNNLIIKNEKIWEIFKIIAESSFYVGIIVSVMVCLIQLILSNFLKLKKVVFNFEE